MLIHWNKILNTDCKVVRIKDQLVYPIFRVGSTSLVHSASEIYTNHEINGLKNIIILLRSPEERFVSGLNEYCQQNKIDVDTAWRMAGRGELIDRHFAPQYMWLLHLSKYHDGSITLLPFGYIKNLTNMHMRRTVESRTQVTPLEKFVEVDRQLMTLVGQTMMLKPLVKRYKDVLS